MLKLKQVLRSPFSVLRSPFSVLRSPLSALRSPLSALSRTSHSGRASAICALVVASIIGLSACDALFNTNPELTNSGSTQTVATPTAYPEAGNYQTAQDVRLLSATSGATIYYTLDGSEPTTESTRYTWGIDVSASLTIKAIAVKDGMKNSAVLTAEYTITPPEQVIVPAATPAGGSYSEGETATVTLTCATAGAAIYYTRDGTDPDTESTPYVNPIVINETTTLKAIAVKEEWVDSTILTALYTFLSADDIEDFGNGATINQIFTVNSTDEWNAALNAIRAGGGDKNYVININANFSNAGISTFVYSFERVTGLKVSIRGNNTVSMSADSSKGTLLNIGQGQTVVVRDVDFTGTTDNTTALIELRSGTLTMRGSASVSGNTTSTRGGGVFVSNSGTFTMKDTAAIKTNAANIGAGLYITDSGTATMEDNSVIEDNTASGADGIGGGVYVVEGTLTMKDTAVIKDNTANNGGGVYVSGNVYLSGGSILSQKGNFVMEDSAVIENNAANGTYGSGGGVFANGNFTMRGTAAISKNTAKVYGGGVSVSDPVSVANFVGNHAEGIFTMEDSAVINGNTVSGANSQGGGVYAGGTFTMDDASEIKDNTANGGGGGVAGTFTMRGTAAVSNNKAPTGNGGGVSGSVTMEGASVIKGNTSGADSTGGGGGVYVTGSLTMRDTASISNNEVISGKGGGGGVYSMGPVTMEGSAAIKANNARSGGGVYITDVTYDIFRMNGDAVIAGNTAIVAGGGVYVADDYDYLASFQIISGTVYGSSAGDNSNRVIANGTPVANSGAALFKDGSARAQYGTLSGETFTKVDDLNTTDNTISVLNGVLK